MTENQALTYIHSLLRFGSKPGIERIEKVLKALGNPEDKLNIVHVAGTNGKGSTSTFISAILSEAGYKTGLYTSPFITCFNERIKLNGENISGEDLAYYTEVVKSASDSALGYDDPLTEFEFITALAFKYYADKKADAVVLEVGLGGRLDATNVVKRPKVSVITKIDLDHTGILGDTIEQIAFEKCGIIKNGCPVVSTAENKGAAEDVICQNANAKCSKLTIAPTAENIISFDISGSEFEALNEKFKISLSGKHQITNALTAVTAINIAFPEISTKTIQNGLVKATIPARCEVVSKKPLVILDGSHNPNGTGALYKHLSGNNINDAVAIVGFMADKDVSDAIKLTSPLFSHMITVEVVSNKRSMTADALKEVCEKYCSSVETAKNYQEAIEKAKAKNRPIIVFGSLYLAGDIRPILLSHFATK